jgi:hypothetical protein
VQDLVAVEVLHRRPSGVCAREHVGARARVRYARARACVCVSVRRRVRGNLECCCQ